MTATTTTTKIEARAWLGSLSAYNDGKLLGEWFEWDEIPADPREWVEAMVAKGGFPSSTLAVINGSTPVGRKVVIETLAERHEEIVALDSEGYEWTGESEPDLLTLSKANDVLTLLAAEDIDLSVYGMFLDWQGGDRLDTANVATFSEMYRGNWSSAAEFVESWHEDCGSDLGALAEYIDWERMARDWQSEGMWTEYLGGGEYAVFLE